MPRLPRLSPAQREVLEPGPQMDLAMWYAVRRLPRVMHPLRVWPAPCPWSTDDHEALHLIQWLAQHFPSRFWDIDLAYRWSIDPDQAWTCVISPHATGSWVVEGQGASLAEAFCRAFLEEEYDEMSALVPAWMATDAEAPVPLMDVGTPAPLFDGGVDPGDAMVEWGLWPVKEPHDAL